MTVAPRCKREYTVRSGGTASIPGGVVVLDTPLFRAAQVPGATGTRENDESDKVGETTAGGWRDIHNNKKRSYGEYINRDKKTIFSHQLPPSPVHGAALSHLLLVQLST